MADARTALALVPDTLLARLEPALSRAGLRMLARDATSNAVAAFDQCAANPVALVILSQRADGSDAIACKLLRSVGFPVLLLSSVNGPIPVNAARKAVGASSALGATFGDPDLAAAIKTLTAQPEAAPRAPVKVPPPTPASETDPGWNLARYCMRVSTGSLRLAAKEGTAECTVLLSEGHPVGAVTNVRGGRLGEILVRKGRITAEQVERAMRVVERKKDVRIGTVLVDQGAIKREEMLAEVGAQYATRVITALAWPSVTTTVRFDAIPADDARIGERREALFVEALRRQYNVVRLKALLPLDVVFEFTKDASARLALFGFKPLETAVLASIDGTRPVSELIVRAGNPVDSLRALYAAYCMDLIRPRGQA